MNERIEAHFLDPQNIGVLDSYSYKLSKKTPVCGDQTDFYIVEKDGYVEEVKYMAYGCSVFIASCSLLSEYLKGQKLEKLSGLTKEVVDQLLGKLEPSESHVTDILLALAGELHHANS